ncbi:hypothetical protein NQ318_006721, partial [Aromia moschata]
GWYILRDWSETDFDRNTLLENLHVRYGVSPFFKISVEPNPNMPGHNSIRISPSGLGLPDRKYYYMDEDDRIQTAYKQYIRDVIIDLNNAANEATKFGTDMFSYEKRIAEVTPDRNTLQNPIHTYNAVSLSELKLTNMINFYDILQAMYPDSNITEHTEVIVTSLDYIHKIAQIIGTTDSRTLNGYLIWTLVHKYIPYLSDKYTSPLDSFNNDLYGIKEPQQRWEMCSRLVRNVMGLAVDNYLEKTNPVSEESVRVVNNTFGFIVDVVKKRINKFENTALLYKHLQFKLSTLELQIGVPKQARNETFMKTYYLGLRIIKSNLFETVRNGIYFQKKIEEKKLSNSAIDETVMSHALADVPKVVYSPSDHKIVVPRNLLMEPVFEHNFPNPVIYGRLGVELAEAVVSSVLPYNSLWTANKKILSPSHMTVDESIRAVQSPIKCLADVISNKHSTVPEQVVNETSLRALIHLSAVSVAQEALHLSLENKEHIHQPSLEGYEDPALFFMSYAQTQCSESTSQHKLYEEVINFQLPQKSLLHLAWTQISEFSESLECSVAEDLLCRDIF